MPRLARSLLAMLTMIPFAPPASAAEVGVFDSAGKLTAMIHDGARIPVHAGLVVRFQGGPEVEIQPHDQRSPITRYGNALAWKGTTTLPDGAALDFDVSWLEAAAGPNGASHLGFTGKLHYAGGRRPLIIESADWVIDLPRSLLAGGDFHVNGSDPHRVEPPHPLPQRKPAAALFDGDSAGLHFADAAKNWRFSLESERRQHITITDHWDGDERSYRVRFRLAEDLWQPGTQVQLVLNLFLDGRPSAAPAILSVDVATPLYPFDGFGANYCWGTDAQVTGYMLDNLKLSWSRHELKAIAWDREREKPGEALVDDFKRIQRIQKMGAPWIISVWRVPERFYTDPNTRPPGTFGRHIASERWDELLALFGSYLHHLKKNYGAEPDLFSFNEPDLGVDIGFSPEAHRDVIRRVGAYLKNEGFKTRMLLGDTANPRDSHRYVLAAAADSGAMKYVGALSFHSWGNGTKEQYTAWNEVARWLGLPLLIGEQGLDPGSWRNRNYDSFDYGLREMEQTQNLLRYAQPQSTLYWQYTQDYALARLGDDGKVEPTGRFWMMKQVANLTPFTSVAIASASDQQDVLVSAFTKNGETVVHILNLGAKRKATLTGLPGKVRAWLTIEADGMLQEDGVDPTSLTLQPRSLTTLVSTANR